MSFQTLFMESKGQPILYRDKVLKMVDRISLSSSIISMKIEFISTNSEWKQGIVLQTKGTFEVNGQILPTKVILWEDTAPQKVEALVKSKDKTLLIYNVWKTEDGTIHYWHNGGAFYIEQSNESFIYYCNDGYDDDDFNDLVFKIDFS